MSINLNDKISQYEVNEILNDLGFEKLDGCIFHDLTIGCSVEINLVGYTLKHLFDWFMNYQYGKGMVRGKIIGNDEAKKEIREVLGL